MSEQNSGYTMVEIGCVLIITLYELNNYIYFNRILVSKASRSSWKSTNATTKNIMTALHVQD